jgi:large subunit ribosomal protein L25
MSEVRLAAESRTEFGKGAARRVRRGSRVPAVLYGHGLPPRHMSLPGHDLMMALKTPNVLLTVDIDGASELALPKAVQRDPIKGFIEHVDLLAVRRGEKVTIDIAVNMVGVVVSGGFLDQSLNSLVVEAEATDIPSGIEIDITDLPIGTSITAGSIALPAGTTLVTDPAVSVFHVSASARSAADTVSDAAPDAAVSGAVIS